MRAVEYDSYWGWVARCTKCKRELGPGGEQGWRWRTRSVARAVVAEGCDCKSSDNRQVK